jgi:hypothetical protein
VLWGIIFSGLVAGMLSIAEPMVPQQFLPFILSCAQASSDIINSILRCSAVVPGFQLSGFEDLYFWEHALRPSTLFCVLTFYLSWSWIIFFTSGCEVYLVSREALRACLRQWQRVGIPLLILLLELLIIKAAEPFAAPSRLFSGTGNLRYLFCFTNIVLFMLVLPSWWETLNRTSFRNSSTPTDKR